MTRIALADLLGASVLVGDVRIGETVGVYFDAGLERVIGLEVACAGGLRRFLPWSVASFEQGSVRASSALYLLDAAGGYERQGAVPLYEGTEIRGLSVSLDGRVRPDTEGVSAELAVGTSLA